MALSRFVMQQLNSHAFAWFFRVLYLNRGSRIHSLVRHPSPDPQSVAQETIRNARE